LRLGVDSGCTLKTDIINSGSPDFKFAIAWQKEKKMLGTIAIVLIILWLLGLVSSYTMGGLIHILLVVAVIMILVRLIQGRRL
jgi:hypothetical protein